MTTEQLAIIVPGVTAVALAAGSLWYQAWLTKKTLTHQTTITETTLNHERSVAREQRVQERRADTYVEMLEMFDWVMEIVNATQPVLEPGPEPPPEPEREKMRASQARIAAHASAEIRDLIDQRWIPSRVAFFIAASNLAQMRKARADGVEERLIYGVSVHEQYGKVEQHRRELRQVVREIKDLVNTELSA